MVGRLGLKLRQIRETQTCFFFRFEENLRAVSAAAARTLS